MSCRLRIWRKPEIEKHEWNSRNEAFEIRLRIMSQLYEGQGFLWRLKRIESFLCDSRTRRAVEANFLLRSSNRLFNAGYKFMFKFIQLLTIS